MFFEHVFKNVELLSQFKNNQKVCSPTNSMYETSNIIYMVF